MVRILEVHDDVTGRKLNTNYQGEIFGWLQNPVGTAPTLQLGHHAVLNTVFEAPSLRLLASNINELEYDDEQTAARLVIAGVDYTDVEASGITPNLDESLEALGAVPFANAYTRRMGAVASTYADVFSNQNFSANEMYLWLRRKTVRPPETISPLAQHRIDQLMRAGDPAEARKTLERVPYRTSEISAQLLAGFSSRVILSAFTPEDVKLASEDIRKTIRKRYTLPARRATQVVADMSRNERALRLLQPDPDWGDRSVCTKDDDGILETSAGKSAVDPRARMLCYSCPVRIDCLNASLDNSSPVVRGGLSGAERTRLWNIMYPEKVVEEESDEREIA